jgi:hypothetical protein
MPASMQEIKEVIRNSAGSNVGSRIKMIYSNEYTNLKEIEKNVCERETS